jgi:hypothetical protein
MNHRTIVWLGAFATALGTQAAGAQMSAAPSRDRPAAKPPARTASIPPSPPPQPIVVNTTGFPTVNVPTVPAQPASPVATTPIAQITWYPTLVFADGRVFANFGGGYEQVLRQCPQLSGTLPPNATIAPCFTVDAYGVYRVMQRR